MHEPLRIIPVYRALTIVNSALARTSSGDLELRTVVTTTFGTSVEVVYDLRDSAVAVPRRTAARSDRMDRGGTE